MEFAPDIFEFANVPSSDPHICECSSVEIIGGSCKVVSAGVF